jgi:hypothetical protein
LKLKYTWGPYYSALFIWTLTDNAYIDIKVKDGLVTVGEPQNEDQVVSPPSQSRSSGSGECTATWLSSEARTGYLNITSASGETGPYGFDPKLRSLILTVNHSNTMIPKFRVGCTGGEPQDYGGEPWGTFRQTYTFILQDSIQTAPPVDPFLEATLEPKEENE